MGIEHTAAAAPDLTGIETVEALRASKLFQAASSAEIAALAQNCRTETLAAGTIVLKEGDKADDVYLLLDGELLSYCYDDCGRELPLERLSEPNRPVGEQAFLSQDGARRSASVRAVTDCRVVRIPGSTFQRMLTRDRALGQCLRDIGTKQIRYKVSQQMALLRNLAARSEGAAGLHERTFPDGTVVFQQGEVGHELYIILSGKARVFRRDADGSIVQLSRLQAGQSFGELGLIDGKPRMATVVADGELCVLTIGQDDFHRAYHGDEQVRSHFAALRSIYRYGAFGVTVQFTAELFGRAALGTLYQLNDGRTVIAYRIIGQDIWSIQQADAPADAVQESYLDVARGVERNLLIHQVVPVGAVVKGAWLAIGRLHELVLERIPLTPAEIEAFRLRGELIEAPPVAPDDDVVVCQCMRVTHSSLVEAMAGGCQTVQALSIVTGAGTVCGGCVPGLAQLTAETLSQPVRCLDVIDRAPGVKSFRFEVPHRHDADRIRPGQHLLVEASIGGVEVRRSYTLTSPATDSDHYEITVRREPNGVMSGWLFDHVKPGTTVSILPHTGGCFVGREAPRLLVCSVGGIGVTPALGICGSAAAGGAARLIRVDYSVSSRADIICGDELRRLRSQHR